MNAVEIEHAVSILAEAPLDAAEFPYAFLEAFRNKATTIKILKRWKSNKSDLDGDVHQRTNIHIKVCSEGQVSNTLKALRDRSAICSPGLCVYFNASRKTLSNGMRFIVLNFLRPY